MTATADAFKRVRLQVAGRDNVALTVPEDIAIVAEALSIAERVVEKGAIENGMEDLFGAGRGWAPDYMREVLTAPRIE